MLFCAACVCCSAYVVGIYKVALTHKKLGITKELLANKVVPFLFPLCIDSGLNLTQVSSLTVLLHERRAMSDITRQLAGRLKQNFKVSLSNVAQISPGSI